MISNYHNHSATHGSTRKSHRTLTVTTQLKQSDQHSLPYQDGCKTERTPSTTKQGPNTELPQTMGATMNSESSPTEPRNSKGQQPKPLGRGGLKHIQLIPKHSPRTLLLFKHKDCQACELTFLKTSFGKSIRVSNKSDPFYD